ncbi:MAG TPA: response regulator [Chthoniobacterales bacterium]|nr:response regulator [Chthoniobacterales bacterium]
MRRQPTPFHPDPEKIATLEIDVSPELVPLEIEVPPKVPAEPARRALLLEDGDDFREVLRDHLVLRGFQVTSVSSGVEGILEIRKDPFDIIVCDMMMPRMGGEMFYWAVTRMRPATAQHFIFFTGHRNNPAIEFFFKRVNAPVLVKPFELSALDSTIDDVLRKLV